MSGLQSLNLKAWHGGSACELPTGKEPTAGTPGTQWPASLVRDPIPK